MKKLIERLLEESVKVSDVQRILAKIIDPSDIKKIVKKGNSIKITTEVDAEMGGAKRFDKFAAVVKKKYDDVNVGFESSGKVWTIHWP